MIRHLYKGLNYAVMATAVTACVALFFMMSITCLDVVLRQFSSPITGTLDIVKICAVITIAGSLPYTTAIKGHVAIEFFSLKLPAVVRIFVDSILRLIGIVLFSGLAWQSVVYGGKLLKTGRVTDTLQVPMFWLPWFIALSCVLTTIVIAYNIANPGKPLIKP